MVSTSVVLCNPSSAITITNNIKIPYIVGIWLKNVPFVKSFQYNYFYAIEDSQDWKFQIHRYESIWTQFGINEFDDCLKKMDESRLIRNIQEQPGLMEHSYMNGKVYIPWSPFTCDWNHRFSIHGNHFFSKYSRTSKNLNLLKSYHSRNSNLRFYIIDCPEILN